MPKNYYKVKGYQSRKSIGYLLRRASKLITAQIEDRFIEQDVSFVQWVILMHLREGLTNNAADLGDKLCYDAGALTRVIDTMEERGLITRSRSTQDRRVVALELSPQGRQVTEDYLPSVVSLYNELLDDFTEEEANQTVSLLTRLVDKLTMRAKGA